MFTKFIPLHTQWFYALLTTVIETGADTRKRSKHIQALHEKLGLC